MNVSIYLDESLYFMLKEEKVNISKYVKNLIIQDLKLRDGEVYKEILRELREKDEKKKILEELRILGAIENIDNQLKNGSKGNFVVRGLMIKRTIKLLKLQKKELSNDAKDIKDLIDSKIKMLKNEGRVMINEK